LGKICREVFRPEEAARDAMKDAGIFPKDIEALFFWNMMSELSEDQYHPGDLLVQCTGLGFENELISPAFG
jgi:hypothetical protein